jgi:hypothetical protein
MQVTRGPECLGLYLWVAVVADQHTQKWVERLVYNDWWLMPWMIGVADLSAPGQWQNCLTQFTTIRDRSVETAMQEWQVK